MANRRISLGARLEGSTPLLEIQTVDENFTLGASSTLKLADNVAIANNLSTAGNCVVNGFLTADKINIDEFIFPDNVSSGLSFKCSDDTVFMDFQSTNGSEQVKIKKDTFFENSNALIMGTNGSKGNVQYANILNSVITEANSLITLNNFVDGNTDHTARDAGNLTIGLHGGLFFGYAVDLSDKPSGSNAGSADLGSFYVKKSANGNASFFSGEVGTLQISKCYVGEVAQSATKANEANCAIFSQQSMLGGTHAIEHTATGDIRMVCPTNKNIYFDLKHGSPLIVSKSEGADGDFNYILNAPRPNTADGGAVHFINGSSRSSDGGNNTYTIRNDSGGVILGSSNGDTTIEGGNVNVTADANDNVAISTSGTGGISSTTVNGDITLDANNTGTGNKTKLDLQGDNGIIIDKLATKNILIKKGSTGTGDGDVNRALLINMTSANTADGTAIFQNGATRSADGGANCFHIVNNKSAAPIAINTTGNGVISMNNDTDFKFIAGRTQIGDHQSDCASVSHKDHTNNEGYGLLITNAAQTRLNAVSGQDVLFCINNSEKARVAANGHFGIGDSSPAYVLEVDGSQVNRDFSSDSGTYWNITGGITSIGGGQSNEPVIAHFDGAIWVEGHSFNTSDNRIKTNIVDASTSLCLDFVNSLKLREYEYINKKNTASGAVKGFIAQEVRAVYPNATKVQDGFIPDIQLNLENLVWTDESDGTFSFPYDMTMDLSSNTGRVKFWVGDTTNEETPIKVMYQDGKFKFEKQWSYVFMYGREVNDLNVIEKDKIFQMYHGAIQQLHLNNLALQGEVNDLRTQINSNNTNLMNVMARLSLLE